MPGGVGCGGSRESRTLAGLSQRPRAHWNTVQNAVQNAVPNAQNVVEEAASISDEEADIEAELQAFRESVQAKRDELAALPNNSPNRKKIADELRQSEEELQELEEIYADNQSNELPDNVGVAWHAFEDALPEYEGIVGHSGFVVPQLIRNAKQQGGTLKKLRAAQNMANKASGKKPRTNRQNANRRTANNRNTATNAAAKVKEAHEIMLATVISLLDSIEQLGELKEKHTRKIVFLAQLRDQIQATLGSANHSQKNARNKPEENKPKPVANVKFFHKIPVERAAFLTASGALFNSSK